MSAAVCLTLAVICWLVWCRNRNARPHLLFSVSAGSAAAFALCELWAMHAQTTEALRVAMQWSQVPVYTWTLSMLWFVHAYLRAGRVWLAWAICGLRTLSLGVAFLASLQVVPAGTGLRQVRLLGEMITLPDSGHAPWMWVGHAAAVLSLAFFADASATAWRRGDRRRALITGGSVGGCLIAMSVATVPVLWGDMRLPLLCGPPAAVLIALICHELNRDVLRASRLLQELRASEADLREHEARMASAVDAADFGIWIRDLASNRVWASERWRQLFGLGPSDSLEFDDLLRRVHPDDREALGQAQARAVAAAEQGSYHIEYRLLADGAIRWISSWGRVEADPAGVPVLLRGASQDISARKLSEQRMQHLRQEIAHTGRVALVGQLASALTDEISQPLAAILRNAEAGELLLQQPSPDVDEVQAILADIGKDDQRAGAVIARMRPLLRRQPLEPRRLDVRTLVTEVIALVRVDAARRQVRLDVDVAAALPPVSGDRVHLQQVLLNLLVNGMDALEGSTGSRRRIGVSAGLNAAQLVEIVVHDEGPGLSPDTLAHIFDPLFTTKPNGMGMGLTLSRSIVEAHGGRLWVEQGSDGGAVFRLTLPVARTPDGGAGVSHPHAHA